MAQMVMNLIDFRMDLDQAIAAPRISFAEPDVLMVEEAISRARARCARGHGPQGADHTGAGERARAHDRVQLRQSARPVRGRSRSRGAGAAKGY